MTVGGVASNRPSQPTIEAIVPDPQDGSVVRIRCDDRVYRIDRELVAAEGLRVGDPVDHRRAQLLAEAAAAVGARLRALRLLAFRSLTEHEMRTRLQREDFSPDAIDTALQWLRARGYVDDRRLAEAWVSHRAERRGSGPIRLRHELMRRGVDAALLGEVLAEHLDDARVEEMAEREATRRLRNMRQEPERKIYARLYAYLQRRGYPSEVIRRTLRRLFHDPNLTNA